MDKNGQMTFSDDPLLGGINEVQHLIESGEFSLAVKKLDDLMTVNPDYPGLIEGYRTARFWHNREKELNSLEDGKATADFLMEQWREFDEYCHSMEMSSSASYRAAMRWFFTGLEHYKIHSETGEHHGDFELLLNLGDCFLRLEEYSNAVETLEYARNSFRSSARLLAILGSPITTWTMFPGRSFTSGTLFSSARGKST
jgi:tetratricopeptide (TPR) repeat protein